MRKIILASGSPRRKELLRMLLGDNFEIKQSAYQEETISDLMPKDLVSYHALEKGRDVAGQLDEGVIISADTIVVFNNQILGKPYTQEKARDKNLWPWLLRIQNFIRCSGNYLSFSGSEGSKI